METYGGLNVGNYSPPLGPLTKLEEEFKTLVEQGILLFLSPICSKIWL